MNTTRRELIAGLMLVGVAGAGCARTGRDPAQPTSRSRGLPNPVRSDDLITWEQASDALPQLPEWTDGGDIRAPEVARAADGRWLMYYTRHRTR